LRLPNKFSWSKRCCCSGFYQFFLEQQQRIPTLFGKKRCNKIWNIKVNVLYLYSKSNIKIMGQYFKPVVLGEKPTEGQQEEVKAWVYSHDYGNGLKLMEHSYLKNDFVQAFEKLIARGGEFYKSRVVWAGDYADEEPGVKIIDEGKEYDANIYSLCNDGNKVNPKVADTEDYRFIVNHTKKMFVDKSKVISNDGWQIHPLPLLTCEGNGRGGGDYHVKGEFDDMIVGAWARDVISVEKTNPNVTNGMMDYAELEFTLVEEF
jgi:hypothetical protein